MRSVGIKALKAQLSAYLRLAAEGEVVLVCDRDRVIAELRAPQNGRAPQIQDAALAGLVRDGLIAPAAQRWSGMEWPNKTETLASILKGLESDRNDR